jgi:hypothetical protein
LKLGAGPELALENALAEKGGHLIRYTFTVDLSPIHAEKLSSG